MAHGNFGAGSTVERSRGMWRFRVYFDVVLRRATQRRCTGPSLTASACRPGPSAELVREGNTSPANACLIPRAGLTIRDTFGLRRGPTRPQISRPGELSI